MKRLLLPFLLTACLESGSTPPGTPFRFTNQGKVCAFPEGAEPGNAFLPPSEAVAFQADRPATITVMAPTCLSSSCSKDPKADCAAVLEGNTIHVTSTATFRQEGQTCTSDCGALVARCMTAPLPAGTYFLQHGDDHFVFMVPSTVAAPCAGKAP